jgi:hypothetical protein
LRSSLENPSNQRKNKFANTSKKTPKAVQVGSQKITKDIKQFEDSKPVITIDLSTPKQEQHKVKMTQQIPINLKLNTNAKSKFNFSNLSPREKSNKLKLNDEMMRCSSAKSFKTREPNHNLNFKGYIPTVKTNLFQSNEDQVGDNLSNKNSSCNRSLSNSSSNALEIRRFNKKSEHKKSDEDCHNKGCLDSSTNSDIQLELVSYKINEIQRNLQVIDKNRSMSPVRICYKDPHHNDPSLFKQKFLQKEKVVEEKFENTEKIEKIEKTEKLQLNNPRRNSENGNFINFAKKNNVRLLNIIRMKQRLENTSTLAQAGNN